MLATWVKVFHVFFMVSWMAGLFYLPRLFVYHAESRDAGEPARGILGRQFTHMEGRLYAIIMRPAMVLTWATGAAMLALRPAYLGQPWLWLKLLLVGLLTLYHVACGRTIARFAAGTERRSGEWYRVFNEAPTLGLLLVAALVLLKDALRLPALGALLAGGVLALVVLFRAYAAYRRRRGELPAGG